MYSSAYFGWLFFVVHVPFTVRINRIAERALTKNCTDFLAATRRKSTLDTTALQSTALPSAFEMW